MESVFRKIAAGAIRLGADSLEVEYREGHEGVVAYKGALGREIARLESSSPDAVSFREELRALGTRVRRLTVDGREYMVRCHVYESYGEDVYRLEWRPGT